MIIKINDKKNMECRILNADIIIIGAGGAGLAAAVAASEKGANVTVLEKRRVPGGNSALAGGMFAAESHIQKQRMVDARRDDLFRIAMDYAHWRINPRIVRAIVDKSGDTIRWLEEKGVRFRSLPAMYPNQHIRTMHIPKRGGSEIVEALKDRCKELGIKVLRKSEAKRLLKDKEGQISGVEAETDKEKIRIEAGSVIIASGGYGGNRDLLKRFFPTYHENLYTVGLPLMGDGLLMAMEIGAATEGLGILQLGGPGFRGSPLVSSVAQEPNTVWVNRYGERFTDESVAFDISKRGNAVDYQPGKVTYTLFDERIKKGFEEEGLAQFAHGFKVPQPGKKIEGLSEALRLEDKKGRLKIAESLDEIAEWVQADPDVLRMIVEEYNGFCIKGHDDIFAKDPKYLQPLKTPPYYAIRCYSCFPDTMGGIKINHHMEVLNPGYKIIPGLFAAGVCAGGWKPCYFLSGSVLGFAINSGRIAGENAAKYNMNI